MELPKEKRKPLAVNPKSMLFYGRKKVGKTTFINELPGSHLIIDLENGTDYLESWSVSANSIKELEAVIKEIFAQKKPYNTVVIDTVSKLEDWCHIVATEMYMDTPQGKNFNVFTRKDMNEGKCKKDQVGKRKPESLWEDVTALPNGSGYAWLRIAFKKYINAIKKCAENVIFVGHLREKIVTNDEGRELSAKDIELTGKNSSIIAASVDAVGFLYRSDEGLMVTFKSSEDISCGARPEHLRGKEFLVMENKKEGEPLKTYWNKILID